MKVIKKSQVKKYAIGGITYTPLSATYKTNVPEEKTSGKSTAKSDKKPSDVLSESLLKDVKGGLVNDYNELVNMIQTFENHPMEGIYSESVMQSQIFDIMKVANAVKRNNELYESATEHIDSEKGWGEIAINSNGGVYVTDNNGSLRTITIDSYLENEEDYRLLTNSNLMYLREYDPNLTGNSSILKELSSTVSMDTVNDYLRTAVTEYATVKHEEFRMGAPLVFETDEEKALGALAGIFKVTTESQREDVNRGFRHLVASLPFAYKSRLEVQAKLQGVSPEQLLIDTYYQYTDNKYNIDYQETLSKNSGIGSDENSAKLEDDEYLSIIARGQGVRKKMSLIPGVDSPTQNQIGMVVDVIPIGQLIEEKANGEKEAIGQTGLLDALQRGEVFRARTDSNVTFGNKLLSENEIKTIVLDEQPMVEMIWLPYKETATGIVPNFEALEAYQKVDALLKENPNISPLEINNILYKYGIEPNKLRKDDSGNWYLDTKLFTRVAAYASDDLVDFSKYNERFMDKVDNKEANKKRKFFNTILKYGVPNPGKNAQKINKAWKWFGGGDWDREDMWRGYVYTTAPDEWIAALLTDQQKIDKNKLTDIDKRVTLNRALQQDTQFITQL